MSTDEEMAIIGKLVVERRDLGQRSAALHSEIHRIGEGLERIGKKLTGGHSLHEIYRLSSEEFTLLDKEHLTTLLAEKEVIAKRFTEIAELLRQAGIFSN